ncbi:MAG: signal recognition particle-docking protein FtsY, partial [Nanoarchaeota archaeon]
EEKEELKEEIPEKKPETVEKPSPEEEKKDITRKTVPEEKEAKVIKEAAPKGETESKTIQEKQEENIEEVLPKVKEEPKKGFFGALKEKIITKKIDEQKFESLFWDLEVALLENNVAVEVIDKIKEDLKQDLVDKPLLRNQIEKTIENTLKKSIKELLNQKSYDLLDKIKEKKPYVICFVGINGSGKTTSIAKIAKLLQNNKISCVLAAADTFRAAAIDQLQQHADNLGVRLIKHDYGSDPAAVAFDAIQHAKSKNIDVVLIDTAGRMHSNINLTDEMKKIIRVSKPDLKLFVGEAITGNDCIEQAQKFDEAIGIDGIILSKADIDEKGGAAVSVSYVTGKPIIYLGTGQEYEDIEKFDSKIITEKLGLDS